MPPGSSSRRWLNQSPHSSGAYSTASKLRQGPRRWITSGFVEAVDRLGQSPFENRRLKKRLAESILDVSGSLARTRMAGFYVTLEFRPAATARRRSGSEPAGRASGNIAGAGATGARAVSQWADPLLAIARRQHGPHCLLSRRRCQLPTGDDEHSKGHGHSDVSPTRRGLLLVIAIHSPATDRGRAYEREMGFRYQHWVTVHVVAPSGQGPPAERSSSERLNCASTMRSAPISALVQRWSRVATMRFLFARDAFNQGSDQRCRIPFPPKISDNSRSIAQVASPGLVQVHNVIRRTARPNLRYFDLLRTAYIRNEEQVCRDQEDRDCFRPQ